MSKSEKNLFAIIGLGRFGLSLAKRLFRMGKEVLVLDEKEELVNMAEAFSTHSIIADATDENVLKAIGIRNFDAVCVCIGGNMEASLLTTLMCKDLGAKYIIAKAKSEKHEIVLKKIGADLVVFPEHDMGKKLAQRLINPAFETVTELSDNFSLIEIPAPQCWRNKTLNELNFRKAYNISVVFIKRASGEVKNPGADTVIEEEDKLIVGGSIEDIERLTDKIALQNRKTGD